MLEAQLWGIQDSTPGGVPGPADANGLADTLLDAIVEGASASVSESQATVQARRRDAVETSGDEGVAEVEEPAERGGVGEPGGDPVGVSAHGVVESGAGALGGGSADVMGPQVEMDGEGVALEDTDEEEQEWREMLGARSAGDVNLKARRRDRSD